jgi:hypothetical protein
MRACAPSKSIGAVAVTPARSQTNDVINGPTLGSLTTTGRPDAKEPISNGGNLDGAIHPGLNICTSHSPKSMPPSAYSERKAIAQVIATCKSAVKKYLTEPNASTFGGDWQAWFVPHTEFPPPIAYHPESGDKLYTATGSAADIDGSETYGCGAVIAPEGSGVSADAYPTYKLLTPLPTSPAPTATQLPTDLQATAGNATDDFFIGAITSDGITIDRELALVQSNQVCLYIGAADGGSIWDAVDGQQQIHPDWSAVTATYFVQESIQHYCPDREAG